MTSEVMFSTFFQYFFMITGLPIYSSRQTKTSFNLWYFWRICIVIRNNIDLIFQLHYLRAGWMYPYSLFGFIDVAVTASVIDTLIGKHRRLIELQKVFAENLTKKNYSILPEDRNKMKALQAFFAVVFAVYVYSLVRGIYEYSQMQVLSLDLRPSTLQWIYIFYISLMSWVATISNVLFYCMFCQHLMAMFKSINGEVEKLGKFSSERQTEKAPKVSEEYHSKHRAKSHDCSMVEDCSVFPSSTEFWSTKESSFKNSNALSLPFVNKTNKIYDKCMIPTSSGVEYDRRFSCCTLGSSRFERKSLYLPCATKVHDSSKESSFLARKIQNLIRRYASVSLLVQETDNLFSLQVLSILSITFLRTCSYIYLYISSDWPSLDCCATSFLILQIFFDFLAFGSVAMEASLVTEEAQKFSPLVKTVDGMYKSRSIKVQIQTDVAQMTVCSFDVQLTAWKFFTVSRSFMPTVIGVTTTYILIILQLHQIVQEQKCSLLKNVTDFQNESIALK